ncbi:MAG: response regulator transcription factor [Solirubrobacterales bacterium]
MEPLEGVHNLLPDAGQGAPVPAAVRLAIVDSDSGFVRVLSNRVGAVGWRAEVLTSPPPVEELSRLRQHAIVIDPAPLGSEAWPYLGQLCSSSTSQVVIVCTGPTSVAQRVRGLRLGTDDWVTKPCHPEEVLARVEAALRARQASAIAAEAAEPVVAGELEIRADMFEAFVGGRAVGLTRREFELLQLVSSAAGRVIPRERIYERVWGYAMAHGDRSVDVFVRKLRKKLESASPGWRYLHTHFGVGYRFDAQEAGDAPGPDDPDPPAPSASLPPA